jgi:LysR family transcriptional regulator, glycine cleavage system transcriptional activator
MSFAKAADIGTSPKVGPRLSHADHAHDAAISGSGVVLGHYSLAEKALRDGQLAAPFKIAIDLPYKYRFVCLSGTETRLNIAAFKQ